MAMSTEDRVAAAQANRNYTSTLAANNGVDPGLTAQYGITDPDLAKYLGMASMPAQMAWADPASGGSRSQEQQAARAATKFAQAGGQAELDRITAKIQSNPTLKSQLQAVITTGNKGDFFSKIGDAVVKITPIALKAAAIAGGADIVMGGALFGAGAGSAMTNAEIASALESGAYGGMTGALTPAEIAAAGGGASTLGSTLSGITGLSANTLGSLVSGAASLYGANQAAGSAADAASIQKQASDAALAEQTRQFDISSGEQKRQFDLGQAAQMPWRTAGESALTEQTNLMGLGSQGAEGQLASLMKSPGYEFRLGEGQKALERSAAARGGLFGGSTGKALTQYGQDYATGEYGNRLSQLSSLSGTGQAAASNMAGQGTNYAGNMSNLGTNYANNASNLLTGMGNAGAASSIAQGSAKQSGILGAGQALSNLFNPPKQQQSLADLLKGYGYAN